MKASNENDESLFEYKFSKRRMWFVSLYYKISNVEGSINMMLKK